MPSVPHLSKEQLLAWFGILEVHARLLPALEVELQETAGLTLSEFDVLFQLFCTPGHRLRVGDLARAVVVTPGGVTRLVARLSARRLVVRLQESGRQAVDILLTEEGIKSVKQASDAHFAGVRRMFAEHLNSEDVSGLVSAWTHLQENSEPMQNVETNGRSPKVKSRPLAPRINVAEESFEPTRGSSEMFKRSARH
jgi:DNA-binding MarR family transcriptional regulator